MENMNLYITITEAEGAPLTDEIFEFGAISFLPGDTLKYHRFYTGYGTDTMFVEDEFWFVKD